MKTSAAGLLVALSWVCSGMAAASEEDIASKTQLCADARESRAQIIEVCTAVIEDDAASAGAKSLAHARRAGAFIADYNRAIQEMTAAIELEPKNARNYSVRAGIHASYDNWKEAIADYTKAIVLDGGDAYEFEGRAYAYAKVGDLDRAIADDSARIRLRPDDADAYVARGIDYEKKRQFDRARADFNQAFRLDPAVASEYDFNPACLARDPEGRRVLTNWPACERQ